MKRLLHQGASSSLGLRVGPASRARRPSAPGFAALDPVRDSRRQGGRAVTALSSRAPRSSTGRGCTPARRWWSRTGGSRRSCRPTRRRRPGERVRLHGGVLAPGFVDLQVNGGGGVMLGARPGVAEIATICAAHGRLGTPGLLPTLITDTPEVTRAAIEAGVAAAGRGAGVPRAAPRGAAPRSAAQGRARSGADPADDRGGPRAPRRGGGAAAGADGDGGAGERRRRRRSRRWPRRGRSSASGTATAARRRRRRPSRRGRGWSTHLFNAMSQLGNREPGLVGAALDADGVRAGLIADGIHVAPASMRAALAAKRGGTGSSSSPTRWRWRGRTSRLRAERADDPSPRRAADARRRHAGRGRHRLPGAIRVLVREGVATLPQALRMATAVPAEAIGRGDLGRLAPGGRRISSGSTRAGARRGLAGRRRGRAGRGEVESPGAMPSRVSRAYSSFEHPLVEPELARATGRGAGTISGSAPSSMRAIQPRSRARRSP